MKLLSGELWSLTSQNLILNYLLKLDVCVIASQLILKGDKNDLFACNSIPEQAGKDKGQQEEGLPFPGQPHLLRHSWCVRIAHFEEQIVFSFVWFSPGLGGGGLSSAELIMLNRLKIGARSASEKT